MVDNQNKIINKLNLRTDFNGVNFKHENLKGWSCQNFTELLNRPGKINSDPKLILKNTQLQIDLDLEKISDISSTKSENSDKSTNSSNKPFKVLMAEDYTEYLEKIKKYYSRFKFNHYSKYYAMIKTSYISNNSMNYNNISMNYLKNLNEENLQRANEPYIPSNKLKELNLSQEFLKSEKEFKIERIILEKKVDELEVIIKHFIEKGGVIEIEVQKILNNSGSIVNFIEENLNLKSEVDFFLNRIKKHIMRKDVLKKVLIDNSSNLILRGNKKGKLENLVEMMENLKKLRETIDKLKNVKNIQEENDLIKSGTEILNKMKNKKMKILSLIEKELSSYSSKSSDKIIEEFTKSFKKIFSDLISFDSTVKEINYVSGIINLAIRPKFMDIIYKIKFLYPKKIFLKFCKR